MFQLDDIKKAHSKVKSGADFPGYVQDLIKLGVKKYDTYVGDGHTMYFGKDNFQLGSEPKYTTLPISDSSDGEKFQGFLKVHQQGGSDYPTFCRQAAETGVEKWTVDMDQMTCTYYDKSKGKMLEERIPAL